MVQRRLRCRSPPPPQWLCIPLQDVQAGRRERLVSYCLPACLSFARRDLPICVRHCYSNLHVILSPGKELELKASSRDEKEVWKRKLAAVIADPMPKLDLDPSTMYDEDQDSETTSECGWHRVQSRDYFFSSSFRLDKESQLTQQSSTP